MRRVSRKKALSLVKELDAFPKVSESYVETSATGGTGGTSVCKKTKKNNRNIIIFLLIYRMCLDRRNNHPLYSSVSSTVSLIAFGAMALLAILEFFVYQDTWMKYEYEVDKDFSRWA